MAKPKVVTYDLTEEQFKALVIKRARAVMKFRGRRDADTVSVCVNACYGHRGVSKNKPGITDDEIAAIAREIADDTAYYEMYK